MENTQDRNPLIIRGGRQCGKTYSVLSFARKHYKHVVYINFFENPTYASFFDGSLIVDDIIMYMSAVLGTKATFTAGETCIILDEIQECPKARTALKFFKIDGRFDIIGTGSLLGVKGYKEQTVSIPVGYETVIDMYPLDFEEFLWANGITSDIVNKLNDFMSTSTSVPDVLHNRMRELLLQYVVVGGMPAVVNNLSRHTR